MKPVAERKYTIVMHYLCEEQWSKMQDTQQGKYCDHCSKEVVDFTNMSDQQIIHYMQSNHVTKGCGRFRNTQIDRIQIPMHERVADLQFTAFQKFLVSFLFFFGVQLMQLELIWAAIPEHAEVNSTLVSSGDTTHQQNPADSNVMKPNVLVTSEFIPNLIGQQEQVLGGTFMIIPQINIPQVAVPAAKSVIFLHNKNAGNSDKKTTRKKTQTPSHTKRVAK
jgi:hypothetical protein